MAPAPVAPGGAADVAAPGGKGLLSKADILAYARKVFGPGDPHADSAKRDANNDAIRDLIKARGTSFKMDLDFSNALGKLGAFTVHISAAVNDNFGQHPKLQNYFGTFLLRAANRGTKSLAKANGKTVLKTTDAQYEAGSLTITRDGRYVWKVSRNDPAAAWVTGKWREATAAEKQFWEGGPSIVLEKARDGQEYTVRTSREKGYEKWIDVGIGKGRIAVNYGRPA